MTKNEELEEENKRLTELLNRSNVRLAEEQLKNAELEEEKCELLGLIQQKDNLIEKMKCCGNCKRLGIDYDEYIDANDVCDKWELAE